MVFKILGFWRPKSDDKKGPPETTQSFELACALEREGRVADADAAFRSILDRHPGHWGSLNAVAAIALQRGNLNSAVLAYDAVIECRPNHAEAHYKRGNALNGLGRWEAALADYDRAIALDPCYANAFCNRGAVLGRLSRPYDALRSYDRAISLNGGDALAHFNRGSALRSLGELDDALTSYDRAVELDATSIAYHVNRANVLQEMRRHEEAVESFDHAIALTPDDYQLHIFRGLSLKQVGRPVEALASFERALTLKSECVEGHYYRGQALHELQRFESAVTAFDRAIGIAPIDSPYLAYSSRGFALAALRRFTEALASFDRAILSKRDDVEAHAARGHLLKEMQRHEEAVASFDHCLALAPEHPLHAFRACCGRAFSLKELKRLDEAVAGYDRAIALKADDAEAHLNRGCVLQEAARHEDALASFVRAIALNPSLAPAYHAQGTSLMDRGDHEAAIASFARALELQADLKYVPSFHRYAHMQICDWEGLEAYLERLERDLTARKPITPPFSTLALLDSPPLQRLAAEGWVAEQFPPDASLGELAPRAPRDRLRIGYFSADFRYHPVGLLTAELFERHDRSRFEIFGFAFGPGVHDAMRARLEAAFDRFFDVSELSDVQVAQRARELDIDIAVDLGGYTDFARPGVFALRVAPIQISYIGYLGTMGAPYMDYLLADRTLIPVHEQRHYAEKIIYLPSYQVNDSKRRPVERALTRQSLGLAPSSFVFSCFNANYKIGPAIFSSWMRILKRVPGSCMFLYAGNAVAERNLRKEAQARGVDPQRIVFGAFLPREDYLARYRAMDLFLDTLPYNAGTTASDALWAGLPVLTCAGRSFASRIGASLLTAIELPELIALSTAEYEERAVHLAHDPVGLAHLKHKLQSNRLTTALFDTRSFCRHIEVAYQRVFARHRAGERPENLSVS